MGENERPRSWTDRIDELAREHPEAEALIFVGAEPEVLSWRDLAWRSAGVAMLFASQRLSLCSRLRQRC